MPIYRGVNGVNRMLKEIHRGVNGTNRKIKTETRGVNGVNRVVFTSQTYLYRDGVQGVPWIKSITGVGSSNFNATHMAASAKGYSHAKFKTTNPVDLTPYSRLVFRATYKTTANSAGDIGTAYGVTDSPASYMTQNVTVQNFLDVTHVPKKSTASVTENIVINLSAVTGSHHIAFVAWMDLDDESNSEAMANVFEVYLE